MKLHIFNPEHDIALATDTQFFTAPHAARQLRADLGFLPSLWAEEGDLVLVDDIGKAAEAARHLHPYTHNVVFISSDELPHLKVGHIDISVWGWDAAVARQLHRLSLTLSEALPKNGILKTIRQMSHRRFAATRLLEPLVKLDKRLVGEARFVSDENLLAELTQGDCVLKAPWSCSGRGIRYMDDRHRGQIMRWAHNVLARQGGIMVEPHYHKLCDFGMEFTATPTGSVVYDGLSLFRTIHGAYAGNIIAPEVEKRAMLARHVPPDLLDTVKKAIINYMTPHVRKRYVGPFGVDMMIVGGRTPGELFMHPCVELNLRRTMGHVALALTRSGGQPQSLMSIAHTGKYRLHIVPTGENIVNNSLID